MSQGKQSAADYVLRLTTDYIYFVEELWEAIGHDKLAPLGEAELNILHYMAKGPRKRGILAPRGIGKTTMGTGPLTLYTLLGNPDAKIIVVSKSNEAAKKMVKMLRGWIETVPFLKYLSPDHTTQNRRLARDNKTMFDVGPAKNAKDPSVFAVGIEGQLENSRSHILIADDVETEGNTRTRNARELLWDRVNQFTAVSTFGRREIVYFGTYMHEESLYIQENKKGVAFRTWPVLYPDTEERKRIMNLAPYISNRLDKKVKVAGDIVFNERHDEDYIDEQRKRGRTYWWMQQMLIADLGDADRYPLKLADLIFFDGMKTDLHPISIAWGQTTSAGKSTYAPDIQSNGFGGDGFYRPIYFDSAWVAYERTCMWVDPSKGEAGDKIGYAIVAYGSGYLWCLACGSVSGKPGKGNMMHLARQARRYKAQEIHVEDFSMQNLFAELLDPIVRRHYVDPGKRDNDSVFHADGWRAPVECTKPPMPNSQKEKRIIGILDPVMSSHRLVVSMTVANNIDLQRQLTRITSQRLCLEYDDELDSLANCCALFGEFLDDDPDQRADRHRSEVIEDKLEEFRKLAGQKSKHPAWYTHS